MGAGRTPAFEGHLHRLPPLPVLDTFMLRNQGPTSLPEAERCLAGLQEGARPGCCQQGAGTLAAGRVRGRALLALRLDSGDDAQRLPSAAGKSEIGQPARPGHTRGQETWALPGGVQTPHHWRAAEPSSPRPAALGSRAVCLPVPYCPGFRCSIAWRASAVVCCEIVPVGLI